MLPVLRLLVPPLLLVLVLVLLLLVPPLLLLLVLLVLLVLSQCEGGGVRKSVPTIIPPSALNRGILPSHYESSAQAAAAIILCLAPAGYRSAVGWREDELHHSLPQSFDMTGIRPAASPHQAE